MNNEINNNAIIFDTETTGVKDPEIIEVGWIMVDSPKYCETTETYQERFKPSKQIELEAMATHHIIMDDLINCRDSSEFIFPTGVSYMIGHNIDYDWKVVGCPDVKRICTLALSRFLWPDLDSHTQGALLYHINIDRNYARKRAVLSHSAYDDVVNNSYILLAILHKLTDKHEYVCSTWEDVWKVSEMARIPIIMPFGKHKGITIPDLPRDYKRWLLGLPDLDIYLRKAIKGG